MQRQRTLGLTSMAAAATCLLLLPKLMSAPARTTAQRAAPEYSDQVVLQAGEGGYHTYRIPAVIVTRSGTVVLFLEGRKGGRSDFTAIDLLAMRSRDNGRTWEKPRIVSSEGSTSEQISIGNPCPVYDAETGRIWCSFNRDNQHVFVTSSDDDGLTWSKPREITQSVRPYHFTRYWTGPGHGVQLKHGPRRGRLIMPSYHMALESSEGGQVSRFVMRSHMIYSDDHGQTWKVGQPTRLGAGWEMNRVQFAGTWIPGVATWEGCECMAEELPDGRLYLVVRNQSRPAQAKAVAWSHDGGDTWTPMEPQLQLPEPTCQSSIIRWSDPKKVERDFYLHAGITLDNRSSGAAIKPPAEINGRQRLALSVSLDECRTWKEIKVLHPRAAAYSDLVVLPDASILCVYEGGENDAYESIRAARFSRDWLFATASEGRTVAVEPEPASKVPPLQWTSLPNLPVGVAGIVGGIAGNRLVVAGGNHFPDLPPWRGGKRRYRDDVYVLSRTNDEWRSPAFRLPEGLSYAMGGTLDHGLVIAGGETAAGASARVLRIDAAGDELSLRELRPLPMPLSHASSITIGRFFFLLGGLTEGTAESVLGGYVGTWSPAERDLTWTRLPPWPGPGRLYAVVATDGKTLYLFSGMRRFESGEYQRPYLTDAYAYEFDPDPAAGTWRRVADLPHPVAAAPTPAPWLATEGRIAILGGLVGDDEGVPLDNYPPFPRRVITYDLKSSAWHVFNDALPPAQARIVVPMIAWNQGWILPAGETLPAQRSSRVDHLQASR